MRTTRPIAVLALVAQLGAQSLQPGDWSFVSVPDTQFMADSVRCPNAGAAPANRAYNRTLQWIVDHQVAWNIKAVFGLGDISNTVSSSSKNAEDTVSEAAIGILKTAGAVILFPPGNHDYSGGGYVGGNNATMTRNGIGFLFKGSAALSASTMATYYGAGITPFNDGSSDRAYWGGAFDETGSGFPASTANSYIRLQIGARKILAAGIEYYPRVVVLNWVRGLAAAYPDHELWVFTHAALTMSDSVPGGPRIQSTRTAPLGGPNAHTAMGPYPQTTSGEEQVAALKDLPNWTIAMSGHWALFTANSSNWYYGWRSDVSTSARGQTIRQIFADFQDLDQTLSCGGNPPNGTSTVMHLAVFTVRAAGNLEMRAISVNTGKWVTMGPPATGWQVGDYFTDLGSFPMMTTSGTQITGNGSWSGNGRIGP